MSDVKVSEVGSPSAVPLIEELFVDVDGARMRYLRAGWGPPIVLVHGLMGYSFSWRFTIPALSQHATIYAVDLLGAGFSDRPAGTDCHLRAVADRLLRFCEAVGISSFDLLGTSHGGGVAMMAAAACQPRKDLRVRNLVLVAPVNPWSPHGQWLAPMLGSRVGSAVVQASLPRMHWFFPHWLARLFGDPSRIPPDSLEGYKAQDLPGTFAYGLRVLRDWTSDLGELESAISQLADVRTLLMWGTADVAVHVQSAGTLRKAFKECKLIAFAGVGHLPYEEVPEKFNAALIEFLTSDAF